jgi:hypothetical protein
VSPPDDLEALRRELAGHGAMLAQALSDTDGSAEVPPGPGRLACAGPRCASRPEDYRLLVEMIYEGYLLHYRGEGRVVRPADQDLALLLGDQLYALGLVRLAQLGDLEAVGELADVISLAAEAEAAADAALAAAVWGAGAVAVGWGGSAPLEVAKAMARSGDPRAAAALGDAARASRRAQPDPDHSVGLDEGHFFP